MNFNTFLMELWAEPAIKWTLILLIFAFIVYWLFNAIYETLERQEVIRAAAIWKAKQRRTPTAKASRDLWDAVQQNERRRPIR
jgi:hypothetical protein